MVYLIGIIGLIWLQLCLFTSHASNRTAVVHEFGEFEPHTKLVLLAMTRSNSLNVAVNHRIICWGATFRYRQMC